MPKTRKSKSPSKKSKPESSFSSSKDLGLSLVLKSFVERSLKTKTKDFPVDLSFFSGTEAEAEKMSFPFRDFVQLESSKGLSCQICLQAAASPWLTKEHQKRLLMGDFVFGRDLAGLTLSRLETQKRALHLSIDFGKLSLDFVRGFLFGLDLADYRYRSVMSGSLKDSFSLSLKWKGKVVDSEIVKEVSKLSRACNLARHLVNLPPNLLNPRTYSELIRNLFKGSAIKTEIWDSSRLRKEKMNLLLAVGEGALHQPCLVKLSFSGAAKKKSKPMAFVGKGITFDSGGLDLKPSSGMRWMKKDMGGSAAVVGFAYYVSQSKPDLACEFYLPLAENSVSERAFRPGDVFVSRSGKSVEIHNTDAEGRLILADALTLAREQDPSAIINVATLTGAIKAGLGAEIAGLFSNQDRLAAKLESASEKTGDWIWRMPLFQKYRGSFKSNVADFANASDGFGGAVTAALFLESFVDGTPWAHLDIYAWKDSAEGPWLESGGSGQAVALLAQFISNYQA